MITRWEIRENTVTSGSVYILAVVGDAGDVAFIEKELYFFCRLVNVKLPPFTHIFELTNISDDDMLEKIRVKIEECINETANNATAVFSADHLGKDLNLDVISPETQVFPMDVNVPSPATKIAPSKAQEIAKKPASSPQAAGKQDIFEAAPGPVLRIAEATRYQEEPPTIKTNSRLSLAKDGLSFDKEEDAFEGGIQLENELDVGDGTFISLDTASAKKLQETTDFDPNAGLSGLLKNAKLEPLNTKSSGDPRNVSSEGVSVVPHVPQTSSGGSILNKIFRKFSASAKKGQETEITTSVASSAQTAQAQEQANKTAASVPSKAPAQTVSAAERAPAKTSITEAAAEVFKEKQPAADKKAVPHNVVVTPEETTPDVFKKTEIKENKFSQNSGNMQGPLQEQIFSASDNALSGNIPVDDIFAAETICDFYANSEEFSAATAAQPKKEVEAILSAKPSAQSGIDDDFNNVPNLLGPAVKVPSNVKRQEPKTEAPDASPLGSLLNREEPKPIAEQNKKQAVKQPAPIPPAIAKITVAEQAKEKETDILNTSAADNIVLAESGTNPQFKVTPTADSVADNAAASAAAVQRDAQEGEEPVYEVPEDGFFSTEDAPAVQTQNIPLKEATAVADLKGFTGVLGNAVQQKQSDVPQGPKPSIPALIKPAEEVKAPVIIPSAPKSPSSAKVQAQEQNITPVKQPINIPAAPITKVTPSAPKPPQPIARPPQAPAPAVMTPPKAPAPFVRPPMPPVVSSQQMPKNMIELNKVAKPPVRPAFRQAITAAPPPPINKKPDMAQSITQKQKETKQILRGSEKNMTQDDLNKMKNLAKPEPKEEEQTSPAAKVPPLARTQPVNLKAPQSMPQVPVQNPTPRPSVTPPVVSRPNMPQIQRTAPIVRPSAAPSAMPPQQQAVPPASQPAIRRPVANNAQQQNQTPSSAQQSVKKEDIAERTKTVDHTIQIPIGQIYKKSNWPLEVPLVPTFTFENMDLASNRFPHAAAMSVIENIGTMYNPFVLYGDGGSGKTHFLNAMAYELSKKVSQEKIFITNGVRFARGIQRYVEEGKKDTLDEFFKNAEVLIVDDIHLTAVNEHNREFISKLLNRFLKEKKQIIISSKYPPESLARFEELVSFRLDQGWVSELKQPRPQHFARIYNKMVQDAEMGLTEAQVQSFFGSNGYTLGEIARYVRNAKVLYRKIKDSNGPVRSYDEILSNMLAISGEDQKSQIIIKSFEDIVSLQRGENMDWGSFGFFFPQDQADKFKWIAYSTMQRAKELGIRGGFNFALKSAYSTEHIISSAFKIANICDNKNLKGAIILGPSSVSCTPSIRDNFYDILSHMLEIMMIRCGIINSEGIKLPSSYVKVLGDVLK